MKTAFTVSKQLMEHLDEKAKRAYDKLPDDNKPRYKKMTRAKKALMNKMK